MAAKEITDDEPWQGAATGSDTSRPVATNYVVQLEKRIEEKDGEINRSEKAYSIFG